MTNGSMTLRRILLALPVSVALVGLSGCGTTITQRTVSGAGIGAAVGAVGAAMSGGMVGTGVIVGGAVGAAVGALTRRDQLHVGR